MGKRQILIGAIVIGLAAIVAAFDFWRPENTHEKPPAHLVDKDNNPVDFSSFQGQVVFVNNWASWCQPCIAEMPSIAELKTKLKDEDVVFVMVSFDEDPEKAKKFMEKKGYDFDLYFQAKNYPFVSSSIPATFILGKTGKVLVEHMGMADYSGEEIVKQLKGIANE